MNIIIFNNSPISFANIGDSFEFRFKKQQILNIFLFKLPEERRLQELEDVSGDIKSTSNSHNGKANNQQNRRRWRKTISCINVRKFPSCKTSWFNFLFSFLFHSRILFDCASQFFLHWHLTVLAEMSIWLFERERERERDR